MGHHNRRYHGSIPLIFAILCGVISGCTYSPFSSNNNPLSPTDTPAPDTTAPSSLMAEVLFKVKVPESTLPDVDVYLDVLDEVTGLALNAVPNKMQPIGNFLYELKLVLPVGSVLKYRFSYEGNPPVGEYNAMGKPVRYRMVQVTGPGDVNDIVSAWDGLLYTGPTGRISGVAIDSSSQAGIPDLLVTAGGMSTITASDGSFLLEKLPPGTHNLVAFSIDGSHQTFQQGAVVAANSTTPTPLSVIPSSRVNVQFVVTIPQENILNLPVRLAGSLYSTGNTFADLRGGLSTTASRLPLLTQREDGRYSLTLALPVGTEFEYKYTLGDGFWNCEHTASGAYRIRRFIVPETDIVIEDNVTTWRSGNLGPVGFEVTVPPETPVEDYVSIQFNPYGWTEPLPMWSLGDNRWLYVLYSPLDLVGNFSYRFCRNDQCGAADDSATAGQNAVGMPVQPGAESQMIQSEVKTWAWLTPNITPAAAPSFDVLPRGQGFIGGVELQPVYHPSWQTRYPVVFSELHQSGANWTVITPTWNVTSSSPPVMEPIPGRDPLWNDLVSTIGQARGQGMNVAVYPQIQSGVSADQWWNSVPLDYQWWDLWFGRYKTFILHFANLAAQTDAQALVLGNPWVEPALPDGTLANGNASDVPTDAEGRWRELISEVRERYSGKVLWAIRYPDAITSPPPFIDAIDEVYLLWSSSISTQQNPDQVDLETEISNRLDTDVLPFYNSVEKPIILGIAYPSLDGAATGCIPSSNAGCLQVDLLNAPNPDISTADVDLQEQVDIYAAFLAAVNHRDWVSGIISQGFYPAAALQDKSLSIHGKPAADILWYWFPRLYSTPTP